MLTVDAWHEASNLPIPESKNQDTIPESKTADCVPHPALNKTHDLLHTFKEYIHSVSILSIQYNIIIKNCISVSTKT